MDSRLFLTADHQPISLEQALGYLEATGELEIFLWKILRQHVLERELQALEEDETSANVIEQAIDQKVIDFRLEYELTDAEMFQEWLTSQGLDYPTFLNQIAFDVKLERLKDQVAEPRLQEYFIENKIYLDRVVLSRLVVEEQALAEELKSQILEDGARFEQLVQDYSVAEDRIVNGIMGLVSRGEMPDVLRASIDLANPGELIGPLEIDQLWYLVRVETFLPAILDESLKTELVDRLFEQWLDAKVQKMDIQLQVEF
jgi:parvulin-like peptidyl-prolyl isomerase